MLLLKLVPIRADRTALRPHGTNAKRPPSQEKPMEENLERANGFEPSTLTLARLEPILLVSSSAIRKTPIASISLSLLSLLADLDG